MSISFRILSLMLPPGCKPVSQEDNGKWRIGRWYIVGEDYWYMVAANTWHIVGEDRWRMADEYLWRIMAEDPWYIVARGVTPVIVNVRLGINRVPGMGFDFHPRLPFMSKSP
jgi:hypothetical protein